MRTKLKISIRFFNNREVRAVWDDNQSKWYFSVLDIVGILNEEISYNKVRNYWKYLKNKLKKENNELVSATTQLKLQAPDGKRRLSDTLDSDGIIALAKLFPNNNQWANKNVIRKKTKITFGINPFKHLSGFQNLTGD